MTILLDETIVGIWYCEFPGNAGNLMIGVSQESDKAVMKWRFRYYKDPYCGLDSKDDKNWYRGESKSVDDLIAAARGLIRACERVMRERSTEILRGDHPWQWVAEQLKQQPWAHSTVLPPKAKQN
jgi:hypothetical protein